MQPPDGQRIDLGFVSIIATTTRPEKIIEPLFDRFDVPDLDPYSSEEMTLIVLGMAYKAGIDTMDVDIATMFGEAACGTPRRALKFVHGYKRLVLHCQQHGRSVPTGDDVLEMMRTTHDGLTVQHIRYLEILDALGGAKGLKPICSLLRMNATSVEELERLLFAKGLIRLGDRGRELTRSGTRRARGEELRNREAA